MYSVYPMDEVTGTTAEHRHSSGSLSTDYKKEKKNPAVKEHNNVDVRSPHGCNVSVFLKVGNKWWLGWNWQTEIDFTLSFLFTAAEKYSTHNKVRAVNLFWMHHGFTVTVEVVNSLQTRYWKICMDTWTCIGTILGGNKGALVFTGLSQSNLIYIILQ